MEKKINFITFKKNKLRFGIFSIIAFLGVETIARMYDWYNLYPNYDIISHLLFGIALYSLIWILNKNKPLKFIQMIKIYFFNAFIWELLETIGDNIFSSPEYLKDIFFFDGVSDIIIGFIGFYIANQILKKK